MRRSLPETFPLWLLIAGVSLALWAEPGPAVAQQQKFSQIAGQVVDQDGNPVPGAKLTGLNVSVIASSPPVIADEEGKFRTKNLTPHISKVDLRVESSDGKLHTRFSHERRKLDLLRDEDWDSYLQNLKIIVAPAFEVSVQVVDGEGNPVADAFVGARGPNSFTVRGKTNQKGEATIELKAANTCDFVFAYKDGEGMDYKSFTKRTPGQTGIQRLPFPDGRITLVLDGAEPLEVTVLNEDGQPSRATYIAFPDLVKESEPSGINPSTFLRPGGAGTNPSGKVRFGWFPHWYTQPMELGARKESAVIGSAKYFPKGYEGDDPEANESDIGSGQIIIHTKSVEPDGVLVRGRIVDTDGRPVPAAAITAGAGGYIGPGVSEMGFSDRNGSFEIRLTPGFAYILTQIRSEKVTDTTPAFTVTDGKPVEGITLTQQPHATRLHGQVTDRAGKPVRNIQVYCIGIDDDLKRLTSLNLPNPQNLTRPRVPAILHTTQVDQEGRYQFHLGPGRYMIQPVSASGQAYSGLSPAFTIEDEKELVKDLTYNGPPGAN